MFVPTVWLAILGATIASVTLDTDPAKMVSAVFGGVTSMLVLLMVLHGPIATNILNVYSAALAALSMGVRLSRTAHGADRRHRRLSGHDLLRLRSRRSPRPSTTG